MNWILIATIIVAVIVAAIFSVFLKRGVASNKLRYKKLDALFSLPKGPFLVFLIKAVGSLSLLPI